MAYTPNNNPYIPGDPYSYDLKWIVSQIKNLNSYLTSINTIIDNAVERAFNSKNVASFQTAAELKAANLSIDALAFTFGYNYAGDSGSVYYVIRPASEALNYNYFIVLDNGNIAIPLFYTNKITPEMFGAAGDGVADDTQALKYLNDYCQTNPAFCFSAPYNHHYILTDTLNLRNLQYIDFNGYIKNDLTTPVIISPVSNAGYPNIYHFNALDGELIVRGGANATINVEYALKLTIHADGTDPRNKYVAYNTFNLGYIKDFVIYAEAGGWVNENKFFGGHIINFSISSDGGTNPNNNIFYGIKTEGTTLIINNGYSNIFYDLRCESLVDLTLGADTFNNVIEVSWNQFKLGSLFFGKTQLAPARVHDNGRGNIVSSPFNNIFKPHKLFKIDRNTLGNTFTIDDKNIITLAQNTLVYRSSTFPLNSDIAFRVVSDKSLFRLEVSLLDENDAPIDSSIDLSGYVFTQALTYNQNSQRYSNATGGGMYDVNQLTIAIAKNDIIKRLRIEIRTVNYPVPDWTVEKMELDAVYDDRISRFVAPAMVSGQTVRSAAPSSGYWYKGDMVLSSATNAYGWVCTNAGSPGTWREITTT